MRSFKKRLTILFAGAFLISCSSCSGLDILNEHLKSGVKDLGNNVAIGKSNALITPYISFDGIRTSDNTAFQASYNASVSGFDGQDILVGNSDLKDKDCRDLTINYTFDSKKAAIKRIFSPYGCCIISFLNSFLYISRSLTLCTAKFLLTI